MIDASAKIPAINPKFKALIPPLTPEELSLLEANLIADGCRDPLATWNGQLLDGHNRLTICRKRGIPFKTFAISLYSELDAMIWIRRNQAGRRNLTDDQRAMNAAELAELEIRKSKADKSKAGGHAKAGTVCPEAPSAPRQGRKREEAAKLAGVSDKKVRQAQSVMRQSPELAAKVHSGQIPLAAATREIKKREIIARLEDVGTRKTKELAGKYDVIVIDPPWPMEKIARDLYPNQVGFDYPVMPIEDIAAMKMPAASDCHLWLWTTHRFLPAALDILKAWNFAYVCTFVWHKPGGFQPIGLPQYNCEFALYARRGGPSFIDTKALPVCFDAPRGAHSEKPDAFYDVVRRVTAGRRIDIFNRRAIDGFDTWGKESK